MYRITEIIFLRLRSFVPVLPLLLEVIAFCSEVVVNTSFIFSKPAMLGIARSRGHGVLPRFNQCIVNVFFSSSLKEGIISRCAL